MPAAVPPEGAPESFSEVSFRTTSYFVFVKDVFFSLFFWNFFSPAPAELASKNGLCAADNVLDSPERRVLAEERNTYSSRPRG